MAGADAIRSVFVETAAALADVPPDFPVPGLPEAFIIVTYQLKDVMESTGVSGHTFTLPQHFNLTDL